MMPRGRMGEAPADRGREFFRLMRRIAAEAAADLASWHGSTMVPFHAAATDALHFPPGPRPEARRDGGMDYENIFRTAIDTLKAEGRYRIFAELERHAGAFPRAAHHGLDGAPDVTVWCSNDYLGMGQHPAVLAAMHEALDR